MLPELRFLVVTGPRIDPASLPRRRGATVRGFVPDLYLTSRRATSRSCRAGSRPAWSSPRPQRPFLYVPLENHFEQNFHVRHRLDNYGAGRCIRYAEASDPDGTRRRARRRDSAGTWTTDPVETDGAARAAAMLAELI